MKSEIPAVASNTLDSMVGLREALEIAVITLAANYPEDALKFFSEFEIVEMGRRCESICQPDRDVFSIFKSALQSNVKDEGRET